MPQDPSHCPDRQLTPPEPEPTQTGFTKCRNCGEVYFDGEPAKVERDPQEFEWVECCGDNGWGYEKVCLY